MIIAVDAAKTFNKTHSFMICALSKLGSSIANFPLTGKNVWDLAMVFTLSTHWKL
jgi:hypothetical protein